jgi:hypothetical protein
VFDEAMGSFTAMISGMVTAAHDFSGMHEVIDVGGGDGVVASEVPCDEICRRVLGRRRDWDEDSPPRKAGRGMW